MLARGKLLSLSGKHEIGVSMRRRYLSKCAQHERVALANLKVGEIANQLGIGGGAKCCEKGAPLRLRPGGLSNQVVAVDRVVNNPKLLCWHPGPAQSANLLLAQCHNGVSQRS